MNWLDLALMVSMATGALMGMWVGFIRGGFAVAGVLLGIVLVSNYRETAVGLLADYVPNETLTAALGYAVTIGIAVAAVVIGAAILPFLAVYFQGQGRPLNLLRPDTNLKTLFLLGLILPVQIWGGYLLWDYKRVFLGFGLTSLASVAMLAVLLRFPFRLIEGDPEEASRLTWEPSRPFFSWQVWKSKGLLISGC